MDFVLAVLGLSYALHFCDANSINKTAPKSLRENEQVMVNEAFLEQKDVLLEMLELKLKEVRDKKKKKSNGKLDHSVIAEPGHDPTRSAELKMTANGISAVGEMESRLSFGRSGKSNLKLIATGISNIGNSNLDLAVEHGNVYIPGFSNLFLGSNCVKHILGALGNTDKNNEPESRRIVPGILKSDKNPAKSETEANDTDDKAKDTKILAKSNETEDKQKLKETQVKIFETNVKGNKTQDTDTQSNAINEEIIISETAVTNITGINTEATTFNADLVGNGSAGL